MPSAEPIANPENERRRLSAACTSNSPLAIIAKVLCRMAEGAIR